MEEREAAPTYKEILETLKITPPLIPSITPTPTCPRCLGKNLFYPIAENGQTDYSRCIPCPVCRVRALETFDNFEKRTGSDQALQAFRALTAPDCQKPLLLCTGGTGSGKSHLVIALLEKWRDQGRYVRYHRPFALFEALKYAMTIDTLRTEIMALCTCYALVLDDWGTELGTTWEKAVMDEIVDARWQRKRFTVFTSNLDAAELQRLYPRIISRFGDRKIGRIVVNRASDYRRYK